MNFLALKTKMPVVSQKCVQLAFIKLKCLSYDFEIVGNTYFFKISFKIYNARCILYCKNVIDIILKNLKKYLYSLPLSRIYFFTTCLSCGRFTASAPSRCNTGDLVMLSNIDRMNIISLPNIADIDPS